MSEKILTKEEIRAAVEISRIVADAIRELGRVPEGHLYAQLMAHMSLSSFQSIIRMLTRAGVIKVVAHEIIWIGGAK